MTNVPGDSISEEIRDAIKVDGDAVRGHLDELVRSIVEETLNQMLDGIWLKRSWGGEVKSIAVLVTVGVRADGHREIFGVSEGTKEDSEGWRSYRTLPSSDCGDQLRTNWERKANVE